MLAPGSQFALLNALRTNNIVLDTIAAIVLPMLVGMMAAAVKAVAPSALRISKSIFRWQMHERIIRGEDRLVNTEGIRNCVIIKALSMYLAETRQWTHGCMAVELRAWNEKLALKNGLSYVGTTSTLLQQYKRFDAVPLSTWVTLTNGIRFIKTVQVDSGRDRVMTTTTIRLQDRVEQGARIDNLIDDALEWYACKLKAQESLARYMLNPKVKHVTGGDNVITYTRHALTGDKDFSTLFFPRKEHILHLIKKFTDKTGKYGVSGYPHKMGILLHGPPGTGKTSFIKVLAKHTGRHIININLATLKTNSELMEVMYTHSYPTPDNTAGMLLSFSEVLFVFEDIDAASGVISSRQEHVQVTSEAEGPKGAPYSPRDNLNLAGLLNALDGVIDTPARMVVMTTNHPEKLDPALVRPGRVDLQLQLTYLSPEDALHMTEHYFQCSLSEAQQQRLKTAFSTCKGITPAMLEQLCAEHEELDCYIDAIVDKDCAL